MTDTVIWRGGRFHKSDIASLEMAEKLSGIKIICTQGGYNRGGVAASAGTHDGGSVIDIQVRHLSVAERNKLVKYLRLCGWAAWIRTPAQGFVLHLHAVRCGSTYASWGARAQVDQYKKKQNGLANHGRDTETWYGYFTWASSRHNPKNKKKTVADLLKEKPIKSVSVFWVNAARVKKNVSRYTFYVQRWLAGVGFYKDSVDGIYGARTKAAYDSWARKNGFKAGAVTKASLTVLRKQYVAKTGKSTLPLRDK